MKVAALPARLAPLGRIPAAAFTKQRVPPVDPVPTPAAARIRALHAQRALTTRTEDQAKTPAACSVALERTPAVVRARARHASPGLTPTRPTAARVPFAGLAHSIRSAAPWRSRRAYLAAPARLPPVVNLTALSVDRAPLPAQMEARVFFAPPERTPVLVRVVAQCVALERTRAQAGKSSAHHAQRAPTTRTEDQAKAPAACSVALERTPAVVRAHARRASPGPFPISAVRVRAPLADQARLIRPVGRSVTRRASLATQVPSTQALVPAAATRVFRAALVHIIRLWQLVLAYGARQAHHLSLANECAQRAAPVHTPTARRGVQEGHALSAMLARSTPKQDLSQLMLAYGAQQEHFPMQVSHLARPATLGHTTLEQAKPTALSAMLAQQALRRDRAHARGHRIPPRSVRHHRS